MPLLCARFPHLGLCSALARHPELRGEPVVLGGRPELRLPVIAASPAALAAGVRPGQPLRQAQQRCPTAVFVGVDETAVEALRERVLGALLAVSPTVEAGDDEACVALEGSHAQYRDTAAWAAAAARALTAVLGEPPAAGLAQTRFVAAMAARRSTPGRLRRVAPGGEAAFLASLPISVLPAEPRVLGRLAALGLDCLGAVAALAPADLQRQFGPDGPRLHRLARGADTAGLEAWRPPRILAERIVLDGAVGDLEALRFACRRGCGTLGERLLSQGLACAELGLVLEVDGLPPLRRRRVPPLEAGDAAALWPAVLGLLAAGPLPGPVSALTVEALRLAPVAARQADLLRQGDGAGDVVAHTVARLHARFGEETVRRPELAVDPGDLPERRFRWAPPRPAAVAVPAGRRR